MADLITNARAHVNLPSATSADDDTINILITAASRAIEGFCQRCFVSAAYDELYDGNARCRLILRQYPLISVQSVRHCPATVLKVTNTSTTVNQQARVSVTSTGLTLIRVASGVATSNSITFAGNATLTALASAITAVGNGWSAQVVGSYGSWPSADLRAPQGALNACGQYAELKLHASELTDFQADLQHGWLARACPWPEGAGNFRVQYTAGYTTVPEDVQEACAELVASWFQQRGRDLSLASEDTAGTYRYQAEGNDQLPRRIQALLQPYRNCRLLDS